MTGGKTFSSSTKYGKPDYECYNEKTNIRKSFWWYEDVVLEVYAFNGSDAGADPQESSIAYFGISLFSYESGAEGLRYEIQQDPEGRSNWEKEKSKIGAPARFIELVEKK